MRMLLAHTSDIRRDLHRLVLVRWYVPVGPVRAVEPPEEIDVPCAVGREPWPLM
jgi:hypothetical protein